MQKKYQDNARDGSWLSRDPEVMFKANRDPKMKFCFSLNAYEGLFRTIEEVISPKRVKKMRPDLPLLVVSGGEDPVGEDGKGVQRFLNLLDKIGMEDVTAKIYPENRHEILNDLDKEQVSGDILSWCSRIERKDRRGK